MKVLILAALVASISAGYSDSEWYTGNDQQTRNPPDTEYKAGKEYVYQFQSQVLTGLPTFSKSHGGLKIVSTVKLDFVSTTDVVMQMTNCQVLSLNSEISNPVDLPPTKQLPVDRFTPLPSSHSSMIKSKLEMPIKFKYENGKVTTIEVTKKETNWSINLKRSILSMLQVRLQRDNSSVDRRLSFDNIDNENATAFLSLVPELDGTCYSEFSVQRSDDPSQPHLYRVMKTRDPVNCMKQNAIFKVVSLQTIENCNCDSNLDKKECVCKPTAEEYARSNPAYFDAKTLTEYEVLSSDEENVFVKKCAQSATYRNEFPNSPNQYIATFSNQTFVFIQQKDGLTINTKPYTFRSSNQPWKHQILDLNEEELMMDREQLSTLVQNLINELENISNQPSRFKDHIHTFYLLKETMMLCNRTQLEQLFRTNSFNSIYKKWKIMVDSLAHCNTSTCEDFLLDKIAEGPRSFPTNESVTVFMLWGANKVGHHKVLDKFAGTLLPALQKNPKHKMAYHHALLAFGSMIRRYIHSEEMQKKMCVLQKDKTTHQRNIDGCRKYEKVIEGSMNSGDSDEKKIAVLKALTNVGSVESLPQILNMMSKTESTAVRVHAVQAVKNLCYQNRLQVLQTISPLLMDVNEDSEIRMMAFIHYLACDPSTAQLHRLIEQEQDIDLKTFFVQTLKNEIRATGPRRTLRSQKAKLVLSKVRAFWMSPDSFNSQIQYAYKPESDGIIRTVIQLTNQTSTIPRSSAIRREMIVRGTAHHSLEFAFRAEGLEILMQQLPQQASQQPGPQIDRSFLNTLLSKQRWSNNRDRSPSVTLAIKVSGQEVSFLHFDIQVLARALPHYVRNGEIQIPIRIFQTYMAPQEQSRKLQPNGMWLINERVSSGVIDVDGFLKIKKPGQGQRVPVVSFESNKRVRYEEDTGVCQFVKAGFTQTGVTTYISASNVLNEQRWNLTFSPRERNLTLQITNPSEEMGRIDFHGDTYTFYMPTRLPVQQSQLHQAKKPILTEDPERWTFSKELQACKSVDLHCQVEGDIYMPELYTYVRDRLSLMPSVASMKRQQLMMTLRPQTSSPRNYTFTTAFSPMTTDIRTAFEAETSTAHPQKADVENTSNESGSYMGSILGRFFPGSGSSKPLTTSRDNDEDQMRKMSVGSMQYVWKGWISSWTERENRTMSANLTISYEYNQPSACYELIGERPPIRGQENEKVVMSATAMKKLNPSMHQIMSEYNLMWGPRSNPKKQSVKVVEEYTALRKDRVCYEQTAYGCKDEYGVFYPVYYNLTSLFTSKNTDIVPQTLRAIRPYHMNMADKVLVVPTPGQHDEKTINMTMVFRSYSDLVDFAFTVDKITYNMSKIYMPFESKVNRLIHDMAGYPLAEVRPVQQFAPGHQRLNPFFGRDTCVVDNARVQSMDWKEIVLPKTDCEVELVSDCRRQQPRVRITQQINMAGQFVESKWVKAKIEDNQIEVRLSPSNSYSSTAISLRVNGEEKTVSGQQQMVVRQQGTPIAIVECDDRQCEIKCPKYGLYVRVNMQRVKVEMQDGQAKSLCGLCSPHPEIRGDEADYSQSLEVFKQNRVVGSECNVEETYEDMRRHSQQQQPCKQIFKHKVMNTISDNQLKVCVSESQLPMCNRHCEKNPIERNDEPVKCISAEEAHRVGLHPETEGDEVYLQDERLLSKLKNAERKTLQMPSSGKCQ